MDKRSIYPRMLYVVLINQFFVSYELYLLEEYIGTEEDRLVVGRYP